MSINASWHFLTQTLHKKTFSKKGKIEKFQNNILKISVTIIITKSKNEIKIKYVILTWLWPTGILKLNKIIILKTGADNYDNFNRYYINYNWKF